MKNKKKNKITKNLISNFVLWTLIIIISISVSSVTPVLDFTFFFIN